LLYFFADLVSAIDADTREYSDEIDHIYSVDIGMVADMWRLFGGQFEALLQTDEFTDCEGGVELDEVNKTILDVERSYFFFEQVVGEVILAVIINVLDEFEEFVQEVMALKSDLVGVGGG
jgi:hypothetical protein